MILSFHPCFEAHRQIILGDCDLDGEILHAIEEAEAVILPQACTQELYGLCARSDTPLFPDYKARIRYQGKVGQRALFRDKGIPHPATLAWNGVGDFTEAWAGGQGMPHEFPFFIKEDRTHEGEGVFFVADRVALDRALARLSLRGRSGLKGFVTQDHIPCGGNVLRAVTIGKRIITYWKRPARPGQEITTINRGALIDHEWRPDLQEKGRALTHLLSHKTGINLAAIDLVFSIMDEDPEPLALEINYYFGRRGLGGTENYYRLLHGAIQEWLAQLGLDPGWVRLI